MRLHAALLVAALLAMASSAAGQNSSLLARQQAAVQSANPLDAQAVRTPAPSLLAAPVPQPQTFSKHDLITIIVRENASHSVKADTNTSRESSIDGKVDAWTKIDWSKFILKPVDFDDGKPAIDASLDREFDGNGSAFRAESLTTRVEAEIIEVKPNGNLVLQASKMVQTDEDGYTLTLTGTCRTDNITADRTILSTQIAELQVVKKSTGAVNDSTKRSWLQKLLDKINLL